MKISRIHGVILLGWNSTAVHIVMCCTLLDNELLQLYTCNLWRSNYAGTLLINAAYLDTILICYRFTYRCCTSHSAVDNAYTVHNLKSIFKGVMKNMHCLMLPYLKPVKKRVVMNQIIGKPNYRPVLFKLWNQSLNKSEYVNFQGPQASLPLTKNFSSQTGWTVTRQDLEICILYYWKGC
jgi:hypothetical protein